MRRDLARRRLCLALAVGLAAFGCATLGVPPEELSEEPIALLYWDNTDARRRAEILARMEQDDRGPVRRGVARLEGVSDFLSAGQSIRAEPGFSAFPGHVALLNPRTLELTPLAVAPPNARPLAWSRDHRRLLFASGHLDAGRSQLYEYDRDRSEVRKLTHGPALHLEGDYAPDERLVISWIELKDKRAFAGLLITAPGGGAPSPILEGVYASGVRWSPRGDLLLYTEADNRERKLESQRDTSAVVVRPPVVDGERRVLARGRGAVFSPDGEWVVFTSETANGWRLQRMRSNGFARSSLGGGVYDEHTPAVSPDGGHIVYVSEEGGIGRLYVRRMDGSGNRILLNDGAVSFPVW